MAINFHRSSELMRVAVKLVEESFVLVLFWYKLRTASILPRGKACSTNHYLRTFWHDAISACHCEERFLRRSNLVFL